MHMMIVSNGDIVIRHLEVEDIPIMAELANNINVAINLRDAFPHPYTYNDALNYYHMVKAQYSETFFAIEYKGQYAGNVGLVVGTDVYRKSAELGYFIGEPYWNKGIMTQAVNLITEYGFRKLDVIRIFSGVFSFNIASQKVLEKCGFSREGISRNSIIKNGKIWDEIRYAKLKDL